MTRVIAAGAAYFAIVFAAGFALGTLRTLVLVPALGELVAVLVELPAMLALSWVAAGIVVRRFAVPARPGSRLALGAIAFALLMGAELALGLALAGRGPHEQLAAMLTQAGMAGLAGQLLFALFPAMRR